METIQNTAVAVETEVNIGTKIIGGVIVGLGATLIAGYLSAGFFAATNPDSFRTQPSVYPKLDDIYAGSTCGTYTGDKIPGGPDDGGYFPPFVADGAVDPDCITPKNGENVCYQNGSAPCLLAKPTPPMVVLESSGHTAWTKFLWHTNGITTNSYAMIVNKDLFPDGWRCFYDATYQCPTGAVDAVTDMNDNLSPDHQTYPFMLPIGHEYYFVVVGIDRQTGVRLHSEVRTFSTELTAATP